MSLYTAVFLLVCFAAIGNLVNAQAEEPQESLNPVIARRSIVSTVECYSCVSCPQVRDHQTAVKACPYSPDVVKVKTCLKYAEKLPFPVNGQNRTWVIRGCAADKGSCEELRNAYALNPDLELDYCLECEGDKCNGASRSVSEMFFAFFAIVFVPIFAKYTLS